MWLQKLCALCIGHGRKDFKIHETPSGGILDKRFEEKGPEEERVVEGTLSGALRLRENFNSTSCANCSNMIFLSAKNYREARVGGSSFLFCRDRCWEEWMAWFCHANDSKDPTVKVEGEARDAQALPAVPEDLKRTYSLQGMLGVKPKKPVSSFSNRTSLGIL